MKRALKIIGIILAILIVALIALPFLIDVNTFRPRLESELSTALGRQVKVGNLSLSIWSGSVAAENLSISDDPAFSSKPFITAKSLKVGVKVMPLIMSKSLQVTDITLDQPDITLLSAASGKWNFSSLGGKKEQAEPSSGKMDLSVDKLAVKDGSISLGKANSSKIHTYKDVDVEITDFSATSRFPFSVSLSTPGGGDIKLKGQAGPINADDTSETPLDATIEANNVDLAASGFVEPSSGIAGIADFDGKLTSDGKQAKTSGTLKANKLKLAEKGAPAGRPVEVKYAVTHDLKRNAGTISQGDIAMGKALAKLTGTYQAQGDTTALNFKLNGQNMPVDELEAMLPALGVVLPSGSSLNGGTLSTTLNIAGTAANPLITGPIKLADTKLSGFNLGSKLAAISKFTGNAQAGGSDTSIQNLSSDVRYAPSGVQTQNINLTVPALGVLTGTGSISPGGQLDYKMNADLSGSVVTGLTQLAGLGGKGGSIPFFIRGTTSSPQFVPDVKGLVGSQLGSRLGGQLKPGADGQNPQQVIDSLTGLFGKKKKKN